MIDVIITKYKLQVKVSSRDFDITTDFFSCQCAKIMESENER
jgi:hypothetical protein